MPSPDDATSPGGRPREEVSVPDDGSEQGSEKKGFLDRAKEAVGDLAEKAEPVLEKAREKAGPTLDKAKPVIGQTAEKAKPAFDKAVDAAEGALRKARGSLKSDGDAETGDDA
jgi:ElaB/YqjD/DUF883 family membrane-anchored ribosome-binding protein